MTTPEAPDREQMLPIGEAAHILGVSIQTVRRWNDAGLLPGVRTLGGQRRFRRADVESALAPDQQTA